MSETIDHTPISEGPSAEGTIDHAPTGEPSQATPPPSGEHTLDIEPLMTTDHIPISGSPSMTTDHVPTPVTVDPKAKAGLPRGIKYIPGYEIRGELGRGGMGVVYKARHLKLNRLVAVKLMLNADHAGSTARERFDAEARAVAQLQHPNIVQVFEIGDVEGMPFFSLEYVEGGTLADRVAQNLLSPDETAEIMVTLSRAMHYAHERGIIHRDLKPGNILLGEASVPKITDFGLAKKIEDDSSITRAGAVVGTPSFMPPEQASAQQDLVGPLSDVYALGAVLYDLLTGRPPFKGANILETLAQVRTQEPLAPSSLQPGVPKDLETICLKCLQKDPAKRYSSADTLADDLQRFVIGEPILARPIGTTERAWRWCRRNPKIAGLLAAVAGLLLVMAVGSAIAAVTFRDQEQKASKQRDEYKDLFETYRGSVDVFVNEAPNVLEGNPLTAGPNAELLALTTALLEDSQGKTGDTALTDRGRLAVQYRRADAAMAKARANPDGAADPKLLDEAERLYNEALTMAESLDQPGSPERDKAAGNRAGMLRGLANLRQVRAFSSADPKVSRQHLEEAVRLNSEALTVQKRVLDSPESGEIKPAEVRTWLGTTEVALAQTHHFLARNITNPNEARPVLLAGRDHALKAEESIAAAMDSGELAPRVKARSLYQYSWAAIEIGRASDRLEELDSANAGYKRAVERMGKLVADFPTNLLYRRELSTMAAEYGDFLLLRRADAAGAKAMYTQSVIHLRPVAQPPELSRPINNLAQNYYRIATATLKTGDVPNAVRLYGLCLEIRETQLRDAERLAASRKLKDPGFLITAKINVMLAQARAGKHKEAAALAQELSEKFPDNPRWLFQATCGFALSAAALPDTERALKEDYLKRAMQCLNRAIDKGYANVEDLERDPDVDPIRGDAGYAIALKRLKDAVNAKPK